MFESLFAQAADGALKALTLEWACPKCSGKNFRILTQKERMEGEYLNRCRYCKTKCRVTFPPQTEEVPGEAEFRERIRNEDFTLEERTDMIRDFAEIASLVVENAPPGVLREKRKALETKIAFAKMRRR